MASTKNSRSGAQSGASPAPTLSFYLDRAEQAIIARRARGVREIGLTEQQGRVLGYLSDGVAKSCTQLARRALVTSQTMTGIVKKLEAKGLVERHPSPEHSRVMLVSLTTAGARRAVAVAGLTEHVERSLREAMLNEEYGQLLTLLDRVAELAPRVPAPPAQDEEPVTVSPEGGPGMTDG